MLCIKTNLVQKVSLTHLLVIIFLGLSLFILQTPFTNAQVVNSSTTGGTATPAMTSVELQALIVKLQAQLRELNSSLGTTSTPLKVGMGVEVTDTLRVRASASIDGAFIGHQKPGAKGVIISGPIRQGGYNWVKVDYESGPDGWNAVGWLLQNANYRGEVPVGTGCSYEGKTYPNGESVTMNITAGTTTANSRSQAGVATYKCIGGIWRLADSESSKTYTYLDTQSITKREIATNSMILDSGYTLYTITLKTGRKIEVKVSGMMQNSMIEEAFRKTGYVGDVPYLISRAKQIPTGTDATKCISGSIEYTEGTKLQTVTENGQTRTIADASFVCKGGKWVIEGSLPKPVHPECIKGNTGSTSITRPSTAECLGTNPTDTPVMYKSCTLKTIVYKHGESAKFAQATSGFGRPSNGALVNHLCQNGEWKAVTKPLSGIGSSNSASSTTPSGSVRGASTDIMAEIGITLSTIRSIIAELK